MEGSMKINDAFTVGAQPSEAELRELKEQGFASIVNLRPPGEKDQPLSPEQEGKEVQSLGLAYLHEPVDSSAMSPEVVDRVRAGLDELPKPAYVHCKGGTRAGAVVVMDMAVKNGMSGEDTLQQAEQMGFQCKQEHLKQFVKDYVDARAGSE